MPIPKDSHYVPGSNRHSVRLGNGQTVSRSAAESIYAQSAGFKSNYERKEAFKLAKQSSNYQETKEKAKEHGTSPQDFNDAAARLAKEYKDSDNKYNRLDKSPNGPLARYLVAIGRRSNTADYAVGDSPKT